MNTLRQRMIDEMNLASLAPRTQETYLHSVDRLSAYFWRSVEELSEKDVREYILQLRNNGAARGTFKTVHFGIQFLYQRTLDRDWPLFTKKRFVSPLKYAYQESSPMKRCNAS